MRRPALGALAVLGLAILAGCAGSQVLPPPPAATPTATHTHTPSQEPHAPGTAPAPGGEDDASGSTSPGGEPSNEPGHEPSTAEPDPPAPQPNPDPATPPSTSTTAPDPDPSESTPTSQPSPSATPSPSPTPSPNEPVLAWREAIFESRNGDRPTRFVNRERFTSCGDSVSTMGSELLNPDQVACLDQGAPGSGATGDGVEAAIAVQTGEDTFHVWFVRVGPAGTEYFVDSYVETGSWWYGTCDADQPIGDFVCSEPEALPMTESTPSPPAENEPSGTGAQSSTPDPEPTPEHAPSGTSAGGSGDDAPASGHPPAK